MPDYQPPWWLRNGHAMTLVASLRRREFPALPDAETRVFDVAPGARVMAKCHWQAVRGECPTIVVLHGLEGSASAPYVKGIAEKAFRAGFNVVRLNQRNCGHTEHLSVTLYHSGLSEDPAAVVSELIGSDGLRSISVAGYSLGGNLALRLAGVYGDAVPPELHSISAVSPPIDLVRTSAEIERPSNWLYQRRFVKDLKARLRCKAELFPDRYSIARLARVRTIREFDNEYTAPHFRFRNAEDYYRRASALAVAGRIRVPTLIISAEDDPFTPVAPLTDEAVACNSHITVVLTRHGGHCGYIERGARERATDGFWAERQVVEFARQHARLDTRRTPA